jgi:hypothetical protein
MIRPLYHMGKALGTYRIGGWAEPHSPYGCGGVCKNPHSCWESDPGRPTRSWSL